METGRGYKGLASFCSIMNMPCLSKPAYQKQLESILDALEKEAKEEMTRKDCKSQICRQLIKRKNEAKEKESFVHEGKKLFMKQKVSHMKQGDSEQYCGLLLTEKI